MTSLSTVVRHQKVDAATAHCKSSRKIERGVRGPRPGGHPCDLTRPKEKAILNADPPMAGREAFVSLATNDYYARGALALGHSIRKAGTTRRLALLITNTVSPEMRCQLNYVWDELVVVDELDSGDTERLALLTRPELGVTFSKIHAWRLTQYSKCVFLDADTLVLQNVDELFDREELSAAPDIGWPDCFNSGVFVFEPSEETFSSLVALASQLGSFDGGDQGLLNMFWSDWATKDIKYHLPFIYNVTPNVAYGYVPAYVKFISNVKIVHFIGPVKPWQHHYVIENGAVVFAPGTAGSQEGAYDFIKRWWEVWTSLEQSPPPRASGGDGRSAPPPAPTHQSHHIHTSHHHQSSSSHPHRSHPHSSHHIWSHVHPSHPVRSNSSSQSFMYIPHPLSVGHYDLPEDTYFVDPDHSDPFSPTSHAPPSSSTDHLNPETAHFKNLMKVPYSNHHAHLSLSYYSDCGVFGADLSSVEPKCYNFDTDVGVNQVNLRRRLSFPYFFSPILSRSSFNSPILHPHLNYSEVEFPSSLIIHDDLSSDSSDQSLVCSTENDDVIMMTGSRDNHVIELPELRQPTIRISDSVPPYPISSSPPPPTHTPQPHITPVTNSDDIIGAVPQEMESSGGEQRRGPSDSVEDQHRLDFQNGRIDYTGRDSFENIQRRLDAILIEEEEDDEEEEHKEEEEGLGEEAAEGEDGAVTAEST